MGLQIIPYPENLTDAVKRFNLRLKQNGVSFQFPENTVPVWLPPTESDRLYQEYFVAADDKAEVRGAYILKQQDFQIGSGIISVGNYQLPLSEGTIDKAYNMVGLRLLTDARKRQPLLYALGMGGMDRPLPRFLKSLGWHLEAVPFSFKVIHTYRFLRGIAFLRRSPARRLLLDLAAFSGLGWLALKLVGFNRSAAASLSGDVRVEEVGEFGEWADSLWHQAKSSLSFGAVRDLTTLKRLYPAAVARFIRLKVSVSGNVAGWAVLFDTRMEAHRQFGNLRVGTIIDCLAVPGYEIAVAAAAVWHLENRGVDLVVSNQAHPSWVSALRECGFSSGPSNFIFAASPELTKLIEATELGFTGLHLNRGDGDGPIHL